VKDIESSKEFRPFERLSLIISGNSPVATSGVDMITLANRGIGAFYG
jgi:hypothetical protein